MRERLILWLLSKLSVGRFDQLKGGGVGSMYITICDNEDKLVCRALMTSLRPAHDWRIMSAALDLVRAIQLRDVNISPWQLFQHLVGYDYNEAQRRQVRAKYGWLEPKS